MGFDFQSDCRSPLSANRRRITTTHLSLTRQIPLRVKRRGIEMRLVIGAGSGSAPRIDSTILKATARAHRWFDDLVTRPLGFDGRNWQAGRCRQALRQSHDSPGFSRARDRRKNCRRPPATGTHRSVSVDRSRRSSAQLASAGKTARLRRSSLIAPPSRKYLLDSLSIPDSKSSKRRISATTAKSPKSTAKAGNGEKARKIAPGGFGRAFLWCISTANNRAHAAY